LILISSIALFHNAQWKLKVGSLRNRITHIHIQIYCCIRRRKSTSKVSEGLFMSTVQC